MTRSTSERVLQTLRKPGIKSWAVTILGQSEVTVRSENRDREGRIHSKKPTSSDGQAATFQMVLLKEFEPSRFTGLCPGALVHPWLLPTVFCVAGYYADETGGARRRAIAVVGFSYVVVEVGVFPILKKSFCSLCRLFLLGTHRSWHWFVHGCYEPCFAPQASTQMRRAGRDAWR
jgi:hypothetical protein